MDHTRTNNTMPSSNRHDRIEVSHTARPHRDSDIRKLRPLPTPPDPPVSETARDVANHLANALAELRACIGLLPAIANGLTPAPSNDAGDDLVTYAPPVPVLHPQAIPPATEEDAEARIMKALAAAKGPLTVQQLAAELRTSSGWVWHWLNLLDPAGKVWLRTTRAGGRKVTMVYAAGSVLTDEG